jgi:acetyl-CoA carboxylase alpha subunit
MWFLQPDHTVTEGQLDQQEVTVMGEQLARGQAAQIPRRLGLAMP